MCWTQPYTGRQTRSCVLCMIVSNIYSVVLFFLFVVVLCLVYGCVTLYMLDTTIHKTQDDDKQEI
jgi:CHASE3 domain sensor protein